MPAHLLAAASLAVLVTVAVPAQAGLDGETGRAAMYLVGLARTADVKGVAVLVADFILPF